MAQMTIKRNVILLNITIYYTTHFTKELSQYALQIQSPHIQTKGNCSKEKLGSMLEESLEGSRFNRRLVPYGQLWVYVQRDQHGQVHISLISWGLARGVGPGVEWGCGPGQVGTSCYWPSKAKVSCNWALSTTARRKGSKNKKKKKFFKMPILKSGQGKRSVIWLFTAMEGESWKRLWWHCGGVGTECIRWL